jgi:hypothetical protein
VVAEGINGGTDLVKSTVSYALAANHENLTLLEAGAIDAAGNTVANALTGSIGSSRLDGGAGADKMAGGSGDDAHVVDVVADTITELASQGTDTVGSSLATYSLAALKAVENLTYTSFGNFTTTDNALANTRTGGSRNDTFAGGAGPDRFRFDILAFGNDRIKDYEEALDHLSFATSVADDFSDFTIAGNGTTTITVYHGAGSSVLAGFHAITLAVNDFIFIWCSRAGFDLS